MEFCTWCEELAGTDEAAPNVIGGTLHQECLIRTVAGSAAHQMRECSCYGGTREDPPGMTKRQAARLAVETFYMLRDMSEAIR